MNEQNNNIQEPVKQEKLLKILSVPWIDILQTVLCILKLAGVIKFAWGWVLLPLWVSDILMAGLYVFDYIQMKRIKNTPEQGEVKSLEDMKEVNPELYSFIKERGLDQQVEAAIKAKIEADENGETQQTPPELSEEDMRRVLEFLNNTEEHAKDEELVAEFDEQRLSEMNEE